MFVMRANARQRSMTGISDEQVEEVLQTLRGNGELSHMIKLAVTQFMYKPNVNNQLCEDQNVKVFAYVPAFIRNNEVVTGAEAPAVFQHHIQAPH